MKKFCISLKECAMEIINFEKKNMIPLTNNDYISYLSQKNFCKEKFEDKYARHIIHLKKNFYSFS